MALLLATQTIFSATLVIPGNANIFGAGHSVAPSPGSMGGGVLPPMVSFPASSNQVLVFSNVAGSVRIDANGHPDYTNGPDGGTLFFSTDVYSYGGIAGILDAEKTMFLVGVFLDNSEPVDPAPDRLDFGVVSLTENFTTLAPSLRQVFFIGDGLTRAGSVQAFIVPAGATRLFLGFADARDGNTVTGYPGWYDDNDGSVSANFSLLALNQWTKAASGAWDESFWSLGQLPGTNQELVAINNSGWKAISIGQDTAANHPQSLLLNNLLIDGPTNSENTLLLNWAYLDVPLTVRSNLTVGANGALVSHYSALNAANAYIGGSASFMDYATENFGQLWLRSGAGLGLTNGVMTCSNLTFYNATFTQSGGTHTVQHMTVPDFYDTYGYPYGAYLLQGGALTSQQLILGYVMTPFGANGNGFLLQTGGVHTNSAITMTGYHRPGGGMFAGVYELDAGLLVSSNLMSDGGSFLQAGGTNIIQLLDVRGGSYFNLSGGELVASNVTAHIDTYVAGQFNQTGGKQTVPGQLLIQGSGYGWWANPEYRVAGGSLTVSNLQLSYANFGLFSNAVLVTSNFNLQGQLAISDQATISNAGNITISGRTYPDLLASVNIMLQNSCATQHLGALQISGGCTIQYFATSNAPVVRFADSHLLPWGGALQIWSSAPGAGAHIFFGSNAQGLTPEQLAQVEFLQYVDGEVLPYAAAILPTGELVPSGPPPLTYTNAGSTLVLTWPGACQLVTATNPAGPYEGVTGATSPFTNNCLEPQRFFRLQLPAP